MHSPYCRRPLHHHVQPHLDEGIVRLSASIAPLPNEAGNGVGTPQLRLEKDIRHITVSELCDAAKISCSTIYNTMGARCTPRPLVAGHGCLEKNSSYFPKIKKDLKRKVSSLFHGGDKRDRTADLLTASQALSQLSYTPGREQLTV